MNAQVYEPDPAAIFACGLSLWSECHKKAAGGKGVDLSDTFNGIDELMREMLRIGTAFETWSCKHVNFEAMSQVWPYFLEEQFGKTCLSVLSINGLSLFGEEDCLRVALSLSLPLRADTDLPLPIDVRSPNPVSGSAFRAFRIQSVRCCQTDNEVVPFTRRDDPFDEDFDLPFFGIYGEGEEGLSEHIADRRTYTEAVQLVKKLAPGIFFEK